MKFELILCAIGVIGASAANLPSYFTPCSRSLPIADLTECVTAEAKKAQSIMVKGIPELGVEPLDPLPLEDVAANAGTFNLNTKNLVLKGLKKMEIREVKWNFEKNKGGMKLFGNLTFLGDYETDGQLLIFPLKGNGKISVKCLDTEVLIKYKTRIIRDADGVEHLETYDAKQTQNYGRVVFHLTNLPGGPAFGETINKAMNDDWKVLIDQMGPPYTEAVSKKFNEVMNKFYSTIPFDQLFAP